MLRMPIYMSHRVKNNNYTTPNQNLLNIQIRKFSQKKNKIRPSRRIMTSFLLKKLPIPSLKISVRAKLQYNLHLIPNLVSNKSKK